MFDQSLKYKRFTPSGLVNLSLLQRLNFLILKCELYTLLLKCTFEIKTRKLLPQTFLSKARQSQVKFV